MSLQYDRQCEIIIGNEETIDIVDAIKIKGLRVAFKIEKDTLGLPNKAHISIYNLSRQSRAAIGVIGRKPYKIAVNAGYKENQQIIFLGNISYVFHRKVDTEIITDIYAADGSISYLNSFFAKTYNAGTSNKKIITDVARSFDGLTLGSIQDLNDNDYSLYSSTFFGASRDIMNNITSALDLEWYINNEKINVLSNKSYIESETIIFNATNGMIKSPIITEVGANVVVLLRPDLIPGTMFQVQSVAPNINLGNYFYKDTEPTRGEGVYRILKITHIGDTHSENWISYIEGLIM